MISINFAGIKELEHLEPNATVVVGVSKDMKFSPYIDQLEKRTNNLISKTITSTGFQANAGESFVIYFDVAKIIVVALTDDFREVGNNIYEAFKKLPSSSINVAIEGNASEIAYGILDASWNFNKYKTDALETKHIVSIHTDESEETFANYRHLLKGVFFARDLIAEPSNVLTTTEFKNRCVALQEYGLEVEVLERKDLELLGMNAVLEISKGSVYPPYVITLKYNGSLKNEAHLAFVGKGVCFDSGGISLKKPDNMMQMRHDMSGAAAVVGAVFAAALQKLEVNVVGVVGLIENMPNGNALKPGDIITSMSGKTIEVITTDAEGRLLLADCLYYTQTKYNPKVMIDLGTLTPETIGCLGHEYAGMYTNDDALASELYNIGIATKDKVWRLPMGKYFAKQIESKFADMKNLGVEWGGENAAAAEFLQNFIGDCKAWVHLDIAGVAWNYDVDSINYKSISGFGVKLLDGFLKVGLA